MTILTEETTLAGAPATRTDRRRRKGGRRVGWNHTNGGSVGEGQFAFRCYACGVANKVPNSRRRRQVRCCECSRSLQLNRTFPAVCRACSATEVHPFTMGGRGSDCRSCGESLTLPPVGTIRRGFRFSRRLVHVAVRALVVMGALLLLSATMIAVLLLNR